MTAMLVGKFSFKLVIVPLVAINDSIVTTIIYSLLIVVSAE